MEPANKRSEKEESIEYWKDQCALLKRQNAALTKTNQLFAEKVKRGKSVLGIIGIERPAKELCPFSVFPEEVWEIVLNYVRGSKDLLTVYRSSKQFGNVLESWKGTWMFDLVFTHVFKWLTREDVLGCRFVCKRWNHAIENFLETHSSKRPYSRCNSFNYENELKKMKLNTSAVFNLWEIDKMTSRRNEMNKHPKNPFLGRTVVFNVEIDYDYDDYDDDDFDDPGVVQYWNTAQNFLSSLGNHIWYVEITEDSGQLKPLQLYKLLRELLIKLPNLRSLSLEADICRDDYEPNSLPLYMANNPLPVMPSLESLNIYRLHPEVPQNIHDTLMAMYSLHLMQVHLNMNRWKRHYSRGFIKLKDAYLSEAVPEKLAHFEASRLEKLTLCLSRPSYGFNNVLFFKTLARFSSLRVLRLQDVSLTLELKEMDAATRRSYLFPALEMLEIQGEIQRKISYSFLLCCPSLKYVNITEHRTFFSHNENDPVSLAYLHEGAHIHEDAVQIQKYLYPGRMYESNVWTVVPTLKTFVFDKLRGGKLIMKFKYTRAHYEYLKSQESLCGIPLPTPSSSN